MKKHLVRVMLVVIIVILLLSSILPVFSITDEEFRSNRDHYTSYCKIITDSNRAECNEFRDFLISELSSANDEYNNIQSLMEDIEAGIAVQSQYLENTRLVIESVQRTINDLQVTIDANALRIEALNIQIAEREEVIAQREALLMNYMVSMQSQAHVSGYFDFVMGAADFSSMTRRIEGIASIRQYNEELIAQQNIEKAALAADKQELEDTVAKLVSDKELLEVNKQEAERQMGLYEAALSELRQRYADAAAQQELQAKQQELSEASLNAIGQTAPSFGWTRPIASGYWVSASVWSYSWGGTHLGVDLAASVGTSLLAPANGLVVGTSSACPTWGSYPGNCNSGWGNYVVMIVNVNGTIYGVLYAHMQQGSIAVSAGGAVSAGQYLGGVGSSGSSTGPHVHAEVYYLGTDSIQAAYNRWDGSITFGTGGSNWGNGLGNRCSVKGYNAPCRENPNDIWNFSLGQSY